MSTMPFDPFVPPAADSPISAIDPAPVAPAQEAPVAPVEPLKRTRGGRRKKVAASIPVTAKPKKVAKRRGRPPGKVKAVPAPASKPNGGTTPVNVHAAVLDYLKNFTTTELSAMNQARALLDGIPDANRRRGVLAVLTKVFA